MKTIRNRIRNITVNIGLEKLDYEFEFDGGIKDGGKDFRIKTRKLPGNEIYR